MDINPGGPKPYQTIQSEFRFGPIPTHSGHFPTQIDFVSFASWGAGSMRHSISRISRLYSVSLEIVKKLSPFNLDLRLKGLSPWGPNELNEEHVYNWMGVGKNVHDPLQCNNLIPKAYHFNLTKSGSSFFYVIFLSNCEQAV
jgi:hypothetical protein